MAATPEKKVKDAVKKMLDAAGAYHFFAFMVGFGRSGIPDIICCVNGKFLAIECKAGKNTTSALQERELAAIRRAGGVALVINEQNMDTLQQTLNKLKGDINGTTVSTNNGD